jgi:hypothetical protein
MKTLKIIGKAFIIHASLLTIQVSTFGLLEGTFNPKHFTEVEKQCMIGVVIGISILTVIAICVNKFTQMVEAETGLQITIKDESL